MTRKRPSWKRPPWLYPLHAPLGRGTRRTKKTARGRRRDELRVTSFEPLEDRRLLAVDYGDAPDLGIGTAAGNYQTLLADNGPRHTIVAGLFMGTHVDGEGGNLQNAAANADDVDQALPDDEDGLVNPTADVALTIGTQPTVAVRVTNTTGSAAMLYGWIDYNADGFFDNASERAIAQAPDGTNNAIVMLTFPTISVDSAGTAYARFRLSIDVAAASPVGSAANGEVEDYRATITSPSTTRADEALNKKITSISNFPGPRIAVGDYFGRSVAAMGDFDGDGTVDLIAFSERRPGDGVETALTGLGLLRLKMPGARPLGVSRSVAT